MKVKDKDSQRLRMLKVKSKLNGLNYTTIYQYEYGALDEKGIIHLRSVWNLKATDEKVLSRFEAIAETIKKS